VIFACLVAQLILCGHLFSDNRVVQGLPDPSPGPLVLDLGHGDGLRQDGYIGQFLHESFYLANFDVIADSAIDLSELRSLLDLPENAVVHRSAVNAGIARLIKKKRFKTLSIEKRAVAHGWQLVFTLQTHWVFDRLHLHGSLIGKNQYRQYYTIEPGEIFDMKKHALGIEKIKQAMALQGYFNAEVIDTFSYDWNTKTVEVHITINQNQQFVIRDVVVCIDEEGAAGASAVPSLHAKVRTMFKQGLCGHAYSKNLLDQQTKKVHEMLVEAGFFNTTIMLKEEMSRPDAAVRVIISIALKRKHAFEFSGNRFFTKRQLLDQLILFGSAAMLISPALVTEELAALYKKDGFWQVDISWKDDGQSVFFFITEGKRAKIADVVLQGVTLLSQDQLHKHFTSITKRHFNEDVVKNALAALGQAYHQQGFWDFTVTECVYQEMVPGEHRLLVKVNEGQQRMLVGVAFEKDYGLVYDCSVERYRNLSHPIPFDMCIIQEQQRAILRALQNSGRLYLRPQPSYVSCADGIKLVWKFHGVEDIVCFGDTILIGNGRLPASVIMRELAYKKGDVWSQAKIEQSVNRLKRLGAFDAVSLMPENLATFEPAKSLLLKYVEDYPYEVRARCGIQGVNRNIVQFNANGISYKLGVSFFIKNPLRRADQLRLDVDFSRFMHDVSISYRVPWLFNYPVQTECKAYTSRYDQPVNIGSPKILYQSAQDGFLLGFSRQYSRVETGVNCGCEWLSIASGDSCDCVGLARTLILDPLFLEHKTPYVYVEPTFFMSFLDNKIQPRQGSLSLITCKGMMPLKYTHAAFLKIIVEQSVFLPLPWSCVLALRGRCGTIMQPKLQWINPIERFYLGGAYSIRSYEPDYVPPLNVFRDKQGEKHLVPVGGKSMLNINTELRFPLYGSLSGVGFIDFGALSHEGITAFVKGHTMAGAAGFGLRINTIVGPLRFDIGWKLGKNRALPEFQRERRFAWFLALGNAF